MMKPAVLIVVAALIGLGQAQNTTLSYSSTTIVSGSTIPITSLLAQTTVTTTFSGYFVASSVMTNLNTQMALGNTFTLFVPVNSAFGLLNSTDQTSFTNCLATSCSSLATIIRYHIMRGTWTSSTLASCGVDFGDDPNAQQCSTLATQSSTLNPAHVAVVNAGGNLYINGAQIVLANLVAQNFTVHLISKWLYPVDSTTSASAFLQTALSSPTYAMVSTTCTMCSYTFANLWYTALNSGPLVFQNWAQSGAAFQSAAVTMFIPYTQTLANYYSLNTLASLIQGMISSNNINNLTALSQIAAPHVIPNMVLFLNTWIANGYTGYPCGISSQSNTAYSATCTLVIGSSGSYTLEVTNGVGLTTGATIIYPDIPVENGVVHIISNVINFAYGNLWNLLQTHPQLTKFKGYVADNPTVLSNLQSTSMYTVFAPDDASMIPVASTLGNNATLINALLQASMFSTVIPYGTVRSYVSWSNTVGWSSTPVILSSNVKLRFVMTTSGIEVDGGAGFGFTQNLITQPDLGATNGILHVYSNNVFGVPKMTVADFLQSRSDLSITTNYLSQMSTAWNLLGVTGSWYSVLAPNNQAWAALSTGSNAAIMNSAGNAAIFNLLTRHYAAGDSQLYNGISSGSPLNLKMTNGNTVTISVQSMSPLLFQASYSSASSTLNVTDYFCTNGRVHILNTVLAVPTDAYNLGASCQNPATCSSATAVIVNCSLLLVASLLGLLGRR